MMSILYFFHCEFTPSHYYLTPSHYYFTLSQYKIKFLIMNLRSLDINVRLSLLLAISHYEFTFIIMYIVPNIEE